MGFGKIAVENYFPGKENLLDRNSLIVKTGKNKHLSEKYSMDELIVRAINGRFNEIVKTGSDYLTHSKLDGKSEAYDTRKMEMIQSFGDYIIENLEKKDSDYINFFLVKLLNIKYIGDYAMKIIDERTIKSFENENSKFVRFKQNPDDLGKIQTLVFSYFLKNNLYSSKKVSKIFLDHGETIDDYKNKGNKTLGDLFIEIDKVGKESKKIRMDNAN